MIKKVYWCACKVYWCAFEVYWCACEVHCCACEVDWCACEVYWCACEVYWCACKVYWCACKVTVILSRFEINLNFLDRFSKNTEISNFIKIHSVVAQKYTKRPRQPISRNSMLHYPSN